MSTHLHLAVELDGAGWHPGARRRPGAEPAERLLAADRWVGLVQEAEAGRLDLVTLTDAFAAGPGDEPGRLDAVLLAARVAPATSYVGLVPSVVATHCEPFHASTMLATVDFVSGGRVGVQPVVAEDDATARLFGRRSPLEPRDALLDEAADHVQVQRRLWDSWEDDAEIRDVATGRFIDRERLHYVDFEGPWFSVRGPSITPRPPQGQLPVVVAVSDASSARLAAASADLALVRPGAPAPEGVPAWGDLRVVLAPTREAAERRLAELDVLVGEQTAAADDLVVDTPEGLAERLLGTGLPGFRLRPAVLPDDLAAVTRELVPALRRRGAFRAAYAERTLRERLGLVRPPSRYAGVRAGVA